MDPNAALISNSIDSNDSSPELPPDHPTHVLPTIPPPEKSSAEESQESLHESFNNLPNDFPEFDPDPIPHIKSKPGLSSYEMEREYRIAQNRQVLLSLGVLKKEEVVVKKKDNRNRKRKKKRDFEEQEARRKSLEVKKSRRLMGAEPEIGSGSRQYEVPTSSDSEIDLPPSLISATKKMDRSREAIMTLENDCVQICAPFSLAYTKLTVWEIGTIVQNTDLYWSQKSCRYRHCYPVGFKATKHQYGHDWTMTIDESPDGPVFTVKADTNGPSFVGSSPTGPWTETCIVMFGKTSKTRVSGPYQFGFTDPFMQTLIFSLEGHPLISDMTTLRQVARAARRGCRFGEKKRGRPRLGNEYASESMDKVLLPGQLQTLDWKTILEKERDEERARRAEAAAKERERVEKEMEQIDVDGEPEVYNPPSKIENTTLKHEEVPEVPPTGDFITEYKEVEMEVEEEVTDTDATPRVVNGRELRSKKTKRLVKVMKKVLVPVQRPRIKISLKVPKAPDVDPAEPVEDIDVGELEAHIPVANDVSDDVIYCICDLAEVDVGTLMVACDFCFVWFHSLCVGYAEGEEMTDWQRRKAGLLKDGRWKCPRCRGGKK